MCARPGALPTCAALFSPLWSREAGVAHWNACAGSGVPPAPNAMFGPPFSPSEPRGVPQSPAASSSALRLKSLFPAALFPFRAGVPAIGVGQSAAASPRFIPS